MAWIAVHEEVLGGKLRGFRKQIGCSEAEALGILAVIWLWARKNADASGLLVNVDASDIASELRPKISDRLDAEHVTSALLEHGWLDQNEEGIYVHDWKVWQSHWYSYVEKKEKDRRRKEADRKKQRGAAKMDAPPEAQPEPAQEKKRKSGKKKEEKPPKTEYSEACKMYPHEYQKLVDQYGAEFTEKLIYELTNYKLANGKKYADDYRAILAWVVDRCKKLYPNLIKADPPIPQDHMPFSNPFG